ncbi:hypothetical protein [Streptantibioticus cattleyicolor]|uniref:Uncharacterized protein n=1 Tax=Streptantibioticus cattleyicolor (strain ATCC 35852 / DSM 46488 / JCM 4925 / NBRC 14057 / NRRL 8057) TaxID=1003195 RepID=F8JL12_STREN|nr:hypothetical protein [Streptantibioticus cattleyicolor]AEW98410.1 hypothetical protein SCATT_p02170 [Streptantibioticus cattleyicolor NRRL 8057 = DSM 46488]CCB72532.1 membrane protein of unknown function [Streptantibioticus cattleyicolor NRRL 8057 = DSM 46488]
MTTTPPPETEPAPTLATRALVALYPPAWRARYATEFAALLADTPVGARTVADVAAGAAGAWARPAAHLHDRPARLRTTAAVVLCGWTALAAGTVLFTKVTGDGALLLADPAHPGASRWYDVATLAASGSAAVMAAGGLPLAAAMLRASRRTPQHGRTVRLLAVPVVAALLFLALARAVTALAAPAARPGDGIGTGWFLALAAGGLVVGAACAAGPASALTHSHPDPRSLTHAMIAGALATALMAIATASALTSQLAWPDAPLNPTALTAYAVTMGMALVTTATSCVRGLRAARPSATGDAHAH